MGKRIHIIESKLTGNEFIKYSSWKDVVHETFKYYGRYKNEIKRLMITTKDKDSCRVEIDGRVIYWPVDADLEGLIESYFVIFNQDNNHYFDIQETPIDEGDTLLDCGACEGYFTKKAIERGAGKIYCFEPGDLARNCLNRTFALEIQNGRVFTFSYLLGSKNGTVTFIENPQDPALSMICNGPKHADNPGVARKTEILTIDDFCNRHMVGKVDFIKADVEGGEIELLYGSQETLKRHKPKLAIAAYHRPEHANQIVEYINSLDIGYRIRVKGIVDADDIPRPVMVHCYRKK